MMNRTSLGLLVLSLLVAPSRAAAAGPAYSTVTLGGYDRVSCHTGKKPVRGNGNHVVVVDGRLYLNLDDGIKRKWLEDVPGNLRKADARWPKVRDRDSAEL